MNNVALSIIPAVGMMVVGVGAVVYWRRVSKLQLRWFWLGAGLWTVAVALKMGCALLTNRAAIGLMKETLSYPLLVLAGGLFVGIQSSVFEIGLTLAAVLIWRELGRDANRAIGVGVGAGAFEACLLGAASLVSILTCLAGLPGTEKVRVGIETVATVTPLFWLLAPVERIFAILCHASSRALVLLGVTNRRYMMVFWGFLIFTLLDGVAGAAHVSGKIGKISMWWVELALLPFALISIPVLRWCCLRGGRASSFGPPRESPGLEPGFPSEEPALPKAPVVGHKPTVQEIREANLKHERSVKFIASLYFAGAAIAAMIGIGILQDKHLALGTRMAAGLPTILLGIVQAWAGKGLRELAPWSRIPTAIVSGIGLLAFPIGTLINGYVLYLVFSQKGTLLFSEEYHQVVAATPHLKSKTSIVVSICLWLLVLIVTVAVVSMLASR